MTFNQHIANYVTENWNISDLPKIGIAGMVEGLESESLIILAGMTENDNKFELVEYFEKAIKELNIELPNKRNAALQLSLFYTDQVLEKNIDPVDGVKKIIYNCLHSFDFFDESNRYAMDSIHFHHIYGLYWTYDDLLNADYNWQKDKTNEELMLETKSEIVNELEVWKKKIKNVLQQAV